MKILHDRLSYNNLCSLYLSEIDVDNSRLFGKMLEVIQSLSLRNDYYLELTRADDLLCSDSAFEYYKSYLPEFIQKNGQYIIKYMKDDKRFGAIASLSINEITLNAFEHIWRYYLGMLFFNPHNIFSWNDFDSNYKKVQPELYGIGYIQKDLTDMTFTKGHDGDNLIITFKTNRFDSEKIKYRIEEIINMN